MNIFSYILTTYLIMVGSTLLGQYAIIFLYPGPDDEDIDHKSIIIGSVLWVKAIPLLSGEILSLIWNYFKTISINRIKDNDEQTIQRDDTA
jgi:hypothetical protein